MQSKTGDSFIPTQPRRSLKKSAPRPHKTARNTNAITKSSSSSSEEGETHEEICNQFLAGDPVEEKDPVVLACVVRELEDRRDQLVADGSFEKSRHAQKAVEDARQAQLVALKKSFQKQQLEIIHKRQEDNQQALSRIQTKCSEQKKQLEESLNQSLEELKARQQKECDDHYEYWHSEKKACQYNRSSQKIRVLRTQQQLLMNAKRFEEARQVSEIADQLAEKESVENQSNYLTEYQNSLSKLKLKHERELKSFESDINTKLKSFDQYAEQRESRYINVSQALALQESVASDADKLWNVKCRYEGDPIQNITGTRGQKNPHKHQVQVSKFNRLSVQLPKKKGRSSQTGSK